MDIRQLKLVGVWEVAELLGVTRQVVSNWRARKRTFPKPLADLRSGPVWQQSDVIDWARFQNLKLGSKGKRALTQ